MITRRFLVTPALARLIGASRGANPVVEGFFQPASDRSVEQGPGFAADPADVTAAVSGPADQGLGAAERAGDGAVLATRPRSSFARFQNGHALAHPGSGRSAQGRERAAGA